MGKCLLFGFDLEGNRIKYNKGVTIPDLKGYKSVKGESVCIISL